MIDYTPERLRTLLEASGWSAYRAAKAIGVDASTVQRAAIGQQRLSATAWRLLQIMTQQSERDALPTAPLLRVTWDAS